VGSPSGAGEPTAVAEHLAHGNAPNPGHALALVVLDHGFVRRTFVNPTGVAGVGPERTPDNIVADVPVHAGACKVQPTRTPIASTRLEAVLGGQEDVVAVIRLHAPRQHQLPAVVEATDALRLGFGFGQRG